jgi:uncharacterized protein (DUF736 family)
MIIGRYEKSGDDFLGSLETLTFKLNPVRLVRLEKGADYAVHGPDDCELGAAWVKGGQFGDYLSVKLDCPSLLAPINAIMALKPSNEGFYFLRWQRRGERNGNGREE